MKGGRGPFTERNFEVVRIQARDGDDFNPVVWEAHPDASQVRARKRGVLVNEEVTKLGLEQSPSAAVTEGEIIVALVAEEKRVDRLNKGKKGVAKEVLKGKLINFLPKSNSPR